MTEEEWLASNDPQRMLEFLRGNGTERKVRLFAVACCHRIWGFMNESLRKVVEVGERYADDPDGLMKEANEAAELAIAQGGESDPIAMAAWSTVELCMEPESVVEIAWETLTEVNQVFDKWSPQCLLRCIFGNPFAPIAIDPVWLAWRDGTIRNLAQTIYANRCFAHMPILGDALEDAGCNNTDILNHCRQPSEHVRGCWMVDLLLGKK